MIWSERTRKKWNTRISEEAQRHEDDWDVVCFGQSGLGHLAHLTSRLPYRGLRNFRNECFFYILRLRQQHTSGAVVTV
uniref:Uncharacterized protein n=1 Tax=Wuchereria bancrofti TaxID=6293 RepID=A0A1I8EEB1_WUCBA